MICLLVMMYRIVDISLQILLAQTLRPSTGLPLACVCLAQPQHGGQPQCSVCIVYKLYVTCSGLWTKALQPLLVWAQAVIPSKQWASTPLFLFGTAGLRILHLDSQSKLLANIRSALQGSTFRQVASASLVTSSLSCTTETTFRQVASYSLAMSRLSCRTETLPLVYTHCPVYS